MSFFLAVCNQQYSISGNVATCPGVISQYDVSNLSAFFDLSQLDQLTASQYFAAGFIVVGIFALLGIILRMFIKAIQSL
jgi:hypothetical protein